MILPIYIYGQPVLRTVAKDIDKDYPNLHELIKNMYDTMYNSHGVGLAAPQIGLAIRIFVVDAGPFLEDEEYKGSLKEFKRTFINPQITNEEGKKWEFEEGCLSIPGIRENVSREPKITITYLDEKFVEHTETFDDVIARIIQHEYDHINGKLFIDHINPLRRKLLKGKLQDISAGKANIPYAHRLPK